MKLIIAEKPAVAGEIAKALKVNNKKYGYFQNNEWTITWCVGHLVTLKDPSEYDEKYEKWNLDDLPIIPVRYELKPVKSSLDQYEIVSSLLQNEKYEFVINATDAGREGELIFDNVYRLSGSKLKIKRLWTSAALTEEAILRELNNLHEASEFDGLRMAARVRAACDWLIGINATRAVTLSVGQYKQVYTIGRVQTPTLAILVKREQEIKNFNSKDYFTLHGLFNHNGQVYNGTYSEGKIFDKSKAEDILSKIKNFKGASIKSVEIQEKKNLPPQLFDLTSLQKEANKIFGFTAEETLKIAQNLYEKHKCLTYPRTDYKHLSDEMKPEVKKILNSLKELDYKIEYFESALKNLDTPCEHIFCTEKVGDHHALLPTAKLPSDEILDNDFKIYDLIVRRLLASLNEDHVFESTKITTSVSDIDFHSSGNTILKNGWKEIYEFKTENSDEEEDKQKLPKLNKGESVECDQFQIKQNKTKPKKRMTEADLLNFMQKPHLYLNEEESQNEHVSNLKEKGIGTPATRANIIKTLVDKQYMERQGKTLAPTEKGIFLIQNLEPESLKSPIMTSEWEEKLRQIEEGKLKPIDFANEMNAYVKEVVEKAKGLSKKLKPHSGASNNSKGNFGKPKLRSISSILNQI